MPPDATLVVTGMGVVSCLGDDLDTVATRSRRTLGHSRRAGLRRARVCAVDVAGIPEIDLDRASIVAICVSWAMRRPMPQSNETGGEDSGLLEDHISHPRTGLSLPVPAATLSA